MIINWLPSDFPTTMSQWQLRLATCNLFNAARTQWLWILLWVRKGADGLWNYPRIFAQSNRLVDNQSVMMRCLKNPFWLFSPGRILSFYPHIHFWLKQKDRKTKLSICFLTVPHELLPDGTSLDRIYLADKRSPKLSNPKTDFRFDIIHGLFWITCIGSRSSNNKRNRIHFTILINILEKEDILLFWKRNGKSKANLANDLVHFNGDIGILIVVCCQIGVSRLGCWWKTLGHVNRFVFNWVFCWEIHWVSNVNPQARRYDSRTTIFSPEGSLLSAHFPLAASLKIIFFSTQVASIRWNTPWRPSLMLEHA